MPATTESPRQRALDVEGVAARLNVNPWWVRRAVRERRIPYYKVGRLLRFDADEIERWLGQQRRDPTPR